MNIIPTTEETIPPIDSLKRPLDALRISVIDRCNLRCSYCMPASIFDHEHAYLPREEILTYEDIARLSRVFLSLGVRKIRLTGGEPLMRRDLSKLLSMLSSMNGLEDLALTTNGLLLPIHAQQLKDAGLNRITISLDTLQDEKMQAMTGRKVLVHQVLDGIRAAEEAGFKSLKINMVVMRGVNEDDIIPMIETFRDTPHELRFIEFMDVGNTNRWDHKKVVPSAEIRERIANLYPLKSRARTHRSDVATPYEFEDERGRIAFVSSVTQPFCGECSRARISAKGEFFPCLFSHKGNDLLTLLRNNANDQQLREQIVALWEHRNERYSEIRAQKPSASPNRVEMSYIGG